VAAEGPSGVSFAQDVLPIFERSCVKCHGGEKTEEGLVLKTYADVIAGSNNGTVIEPGDAEGSYLVQQVVRGKMPKEGPRLSPEEIQTISDWITAGAPDN
jgi:mono/diheme cytochrome c family protein